MNARGEGEELGWTRELGCEIFNRGSLLGASQIIPGKSSPFCLQCLYTVPSDTALAILSKGWDLCCTVDSAFSYLALGLITFGMELWIQLAVPFLLWLPTINTPCRHWKGSLHKYTTQPSSPSPFLMSSSPPVPFTMGMPEGLSS